MLELTHFSCSNWLITPTAIAVGEVPATDISQQSFQLILSGIAVFTFQGEPDASGWWRKNGVHVMPDIEPALAFAISKYSIPVPAGEPGFQYTRHFQVDQVAPFVGLASIEGAPDALVHRVGFACDAWRPHHFDTLTDAFTQAPLPRIFTGLDADLAAWYGADQIHRVNYYVTLLGRVVFAPVIIT